MKNHTPYIKLTLLVGCLLQASAAISGPKPGSSLFISTGCSDCHSASSSGITGKRKSGGDLSGTSNKLPRNRLEATVSGTSTRNGDRHHTKPFKGSDEELQVLVDWLLELKAE